MIKCPECSELLSNAYNLLNECKNSINKNPKFYIAGYNIANSSNNTSLKEILDDLGFNKECCRMHLLSFVPLQAMMYKTYISGGIKKMN